MWISPAFTPVASSVGGLLIGFAGVVLLHYAGEIMGFTEIMGKACFASSPIKSLKNPENGWRFGFLASFCLASQGITALFLGGSEGVFDPATTVPHWVAAVSGFLAGFGTKMANGCTAGHGICGLGRMSVRSFVAVCTFMATAFISATLCSPSFPFIERLTRLKESDYSYPSRVTEAFGTGLTALFVIAAALSFCTQLSLLASPEQTNTDEPDEGSPLMDREACQQDGTRAHGNTREGEAKAALMALIKISGGVVAGALHAVGLSVGGMTKPSKVLGFFDLTGFARGSFDPSLALLFAGGIAVSFAGYQFVAGRSISQIDKILPQGAKRRESMGGGDFHIPDISAIDFKLTIGSALFGVSMGISGFCPSPSLIMAVCGYSDAMFVWFPLFAIGRIVQQRVCASPAGSELLVANGTIPQVACM
mmetsp:Transcript_2767/g.7265  ORF Transcript_2767/g.7265 Transcript_2767/m.7265 type:complete len:422 (-) Transcript_2767:59-1324(-)